jgi:hypothetical protein
MPALRLSDDTEEQSRAHVRCDRPLRQLRPANLAARKAQSLRESVVTDIQLAGVLNGRDVAEQCRAVRADMPIIYTSGNSVDRSRKVVDSVFFEKPYRPAAIIEACETLAEAWLGPSLPYFFRRILAMRYLC